MTEKQLSEEKVFGLIDERIRTLKKRYYQSNTYYAGLNELKNLKKDIKRWVERND